MKIPNSLKWKATGKTLGEGGQGKVQQVVDKDNPDGDTFALKTLSPGKPQKAYERFYREINSIKKLDHPYIIKIFDHSNQEDTFHYYVMEYIEGARPLKALLTSSDNPYFKDVIKSLKLLNQIANAILAYDNTNIVHRDLSPANILILPDETIKIIDFGICQIEDHETVTLLDENIGTPNYRAPECEAGTDDEITIRADVYSAGKLVWSALANRNAFSRETPVFKAQSTKTLFPDLPESWHLQHIFEKTIRQDPKNRCMPEQLRDLCSRITYLVSAGYPSLEHLAERCPICGIGELKILSERRDRLHDLCWQFIQFRQNDNKFCMKICERCGHTSIWYTEPLKKYLDNIKELQ